MNCEDFQRELESAVENRVSPDCSEAREHVKHCKHCRALWEDYDILERAVAEWAAVDEEAPDLSGRVLAVLANDRELRPPPARRRPNRMIAVLAGLSAVALLFLAFYLNERPGRDPANVAETPPVFEDQINVPQSADREPVEMERVVSDARAAYRSLVDQMTESFEPLKNEIASADSVDENSDRPEEPREKTPRSVPPQIAEFQSEVVKPLGFLSAAFPASPPAP